MGHVVVNGYEFFLDEEMVNIIEEGIVRVVSYTPYDDVDGHILYKPSVEIGTDMEKATEDVWVYVDEFNTIEEANECAKQIGEYLKLPYKLSQIWNFSPVSESRSK